jgi:hypothetical protein
VLVRQCGPTEAKDLAFSSGTIYSLCFRDEPFYDCDPNNKASVKLHKRKQKTNDPRLKAKGNREELSFGFLLCVCVDATKEVSV